MKNPGLKSDLMSNGVIILLTVGTSLLDQKDDPEIPVGSSRFVPCTREEKTYPEFPIRFDFRDDLAEAENRSWASGCLPNPSCADFVIDGLSSIPLDAIRTIRAEVNPQRVPNKQRLADDPFPAEISTLYLTSLDLNMWKPLIYLGLLATDTHRGLWCAYAIKCLVNKFKNSNGAFVSLQWLTDNGCTDIRQGFVGGIRQIPGLNAMEPKGFLKDGLQGLARVLLDLRKNNSTLPSNILVDVTGGFKSALPFAGVLGTILDGVTVQSLFEASDSHVRQPALPVAVDSLLWTANRTAINILNKSIVPPTKPASSVQEFWKPLNARLQGLYQQPTNLDTEPFYPSPLCEVIKERAETLQASGAISRHQPPEFVRELFSSRDVSQAESLLEWVQQAEQIWYGDLIPETVEHARGHAQRLWERAYELISPIKALTPNFLTDDEFLLLFATLWVHDVGHGAHRLTLGLPSNFGNGATTTVNLQNADISAFPSLVRDLHSFTAFELIRSDPGRFHFPSVNVLGVSLADAVALCYRFHRGKLSLNGKSRQDFFDKSRGGLDRSKGLAACWGWLDKIEKGIADKTAWGVDWNSHADSAKFITALQRMIDASDVQTERAGDKEFRERRKWVTKNEMRIEWMRLQRLRQTLEKINCRYKPWVDESVDGPYKTLVHNYLNIQSLTSSNTADPNAILLEDNGTSRIVASPPERDRCDRWMTGLERAVYCELEKLWSENDLNAEQVLLLEYLSAFDRVLFKYPQVLHYEEVHGLVNSTVIHKTENFEKDNYQFDIVMEFASGTEKSNAQAIAKDVWDEYNEEVRAILEKRKIFFRRIEAKEANGAWTLYWPDGQTGGAS